MPMTSDAFPFKEIIPLINVGLLGVGALLGMVIQSWIDRGTTASNRLFEERLKTLNEIWTTLIEVKLIYARKISLGHKKWIEKYKDEATDTVNKFRNSIDRAQVILDAPVVEALRNIDGYLHSLLFDDNQKPSDYAKEINNLTDRLEKAVEKSMRKKTHKITLKLPIREEEL